MNRKGVALAAALLVVLLAGVLVTTSATWATAELRAAEAWSAHGRAETAAANLLPSTLPLLHQWFDSIPPGTLASLPSDTGSTALTWARGLALGDSLLLLEWESRQRSGLGRIGLIARLRPDSTGAQAYGAAPFYHPLP
jgi:hypothetical protein